MKQVRSAAISCLCLLLLWAMPVFAQNQAPAGDTVILQLPNMPLPVILGEYENLTGTKVIRDSSVEGQTLSVETSEQMTRNEAAAFIEKSLLLNGFVLVPAGEGTVKIISETSDPRKEGAPVITRPEDIPETDQLITYILKLEHVSGDAAQQAFVSVVPNHEYGQVTLLPSGQLAITENSSSIRNYLELLEHVDVPPEERIKKTFKLIRSDVTDVSEKLTKFLGIGGSSAATPVPDGAKGGASRKGANRQPSLMTIERTNNLVVEAHPIQMAYIESLIEELDAPVTDREFLTIVLRYLPVLDFLPIAEDTLLRGREGIGGGEGLSGSQTALTTPPADLVRQATAGGRSGVGGLGSGPGLGSLTTRTSLSEPEDLGGPVSLVIGKTLLIADPTANELSASGPQEDLALLESLLERIDKRPRQIMLSTVIGQLTLGDDFNMAIDWLHTLNDFKVNGSDVSTAGVFRTTNLETLGAESETPIIDPATLTDIAGLIPAARGLTLYGKFGDDHNVFIRALQETDRFTVLSRPTVYTLNNRKATILSGEKIAIPVNSLTSLDTGTSSPSVASNIQYEEVALRLEVIPLINSDDEVTLRISQINDDVIGSTEVSGNRVPRIGTQELVTTVMVPNKATVLLGGLISDENREGQSGLPILVNVPILKYLAGATTRSKLRQELLIFIQPEIVVNEADLAEADFNTVNRTEVSEPVLEFAEPPPSISEEIRKENPKPEKKGFFKRLFGK